MTADSSRMRETPNPFDWRRPENIDRHPLRYSWIESAIEGVILTRMHQKRLDGYILETGVQIAELCEMDKVAAIESPTPEMIDTVAHYIAEGLRGNPAMGGPMSVTISDAHRRYAAHALRGVEAYLKKWPQTIQPTDKNLEIGSGIK